MIGTRAAIYEVRPGDRFVIRNAGEPSESIVWLDGNLTEPTPDEISAGLNIVYNEARAFDSKIHPML